VKMAVAEAAQGRTGPTISRFLKFCYSYDPTGRRYYLDVTRVAAGFTIAPAVGFGVAIAAKGKKRGKKQGESDSKSPKETS
jgi:protein SCO1